MTIERRAGERSPLRTARGLARLLYCMGRTFDNLTTSRLGTEEFLRTGRGADPLQVARFWKAPHWLILFWLEEVLYSDSVKFSFG